MELDECIPDMRNDVESVWEAKEIGLVLNRFLGTLDAKSCAVFVARYYYSHSIDELAKEYALSARQIKYILSKNRAKLKKYLEKEGIVF